MGGVLHLVLPASLGMGLATVYLLAYAGKSQGAARSFTKTGSVALLALGVALAGAPWPLVAGLAASAIGDYALSRSGQSAFLAGIAAFALAHLAYIFAILGYGWQFAAVWQYAALGALVLLLGFLLRQLWPRTGALRWPVTGYALIIGAMGVAAIGGGTSLAGMVVVLGTALFIISDAVLAAETFLMTPQAARARGLPRIVWVLYYSAQLLLAVGLGNLL
ncbi:MAG: lysoplasmalogenase [Paracoccaceae bacterium]